LTGTYGTFSFNAGTGAWTYLIDNTKSATQALTSGQVAYDSLTVTSSDGTATQDIKITVSGDASGGSGTGIALITSVPAPVYPSSGAFAAEKVAVFNRLNDDRARCGFGKVAQNALLDKSAQAHADYLAVNKLEASHSEIVGLPGFVGSDPGQRIFTYAAYPGIYSSEILGQTNWGSLFGSGLNPQGYSPTEIKATNILKLLYATVYHLAGAVGSTTDFGIGISNYSSNIQNTFNTKTLVINSGIPTGTSSAGQQVPVDSLATYPCAGITSAVPLFGPENPDPFPNVDRTVTPYGQPIYLLSSSGTTITLTNGTITRKGGAGVPVTVLTKDNDPIKRLTSNQVFLVPTERLADNSTYDVVLSGTNTGMVSVSNPTGFFSRTFSFTTGTFTSE
jgi:VCBS repeat-containing protein